LSVKPFELNLQYLERRDTNPFFATILPLEKVATRGGFAEIIFMPKGDDSRWYGAGLFNLVDPDISDLQYTSSTLHCGYLLRRNVRLTTEAAYVLRGSDAKHVRLGGGLVLGF
jgi:hypothetical protein